MSDQDLLIVAYLILNEAQKAALCPAHLSPGTWVRLLKRVASIVEEGVLALEFTQDY
ncbi:hypothetical protein [Nitrospira sp. Nam74]